MDDRDPPSLAVPPRHLAEAPQLLVACDFDGTIAHLASLPSRAALHERAADAIRSLVALEHTVVAIVSGRGLGDLRRLVAPLTGVRLIGSHGAEWDGDEHHALAESEHSARAAIIDAARAAVHGDDRLFLEEKPLGAAIHSRAADPARAAEAIDKVRAALARLTGISERSGHALVEWSVRGETKADALTTLVARVGASAAVFLGDDVTDEDAFRALRPGDVGWKVGPGPTVAGGRLRDPDHVAEWLEELATMRRQWQRESRFVAIERHTLLSDQRTAVLLAPDGAITWACLPRIDAPALFAELLGGPMAGRFRVAPPDREATATQRYVGASFVCETQWPNAKVTDFLDCSAGRPFMRAGRSDLVRIIEGSGPIRIDFAPRIDFGRQPTRIRATADGLAVEGAVDPIALRSPGVAWTIQVEGTHQRAEAIVQLDGNPLILELRYGMPSTGELAVPPRARLEQSRRFWELWAESLRLPSLHQSLVLRSALVLKALCYGPSGAIAAAATTSLPETLGGVRNWDYRFCWLRDAALSATAVARLGSPGMGARFLDWMLGILDSEGGPERFRPVYTVAGGHVGIEAEIGEISGYRASRPVRIGNGAAHQLQLDVFGPILDLLATLASRGLALSSEHWRLTTAIVHAVGLRWREPDHGIWEIRGPLRHHLHSRVMCWLAVDRAIQIAAAFASEAPSEWHALRGEIAADILEHGWCAEVGCFTAAYGERTIDAAALHVALSGLLPGDDPRCIATIHRVEEALREGDTVYRYRFDDGLPGIEGGFELCTTWLIEALAMSGEVDRARTLLDAFASRFGPTGLAAEEFDPRTGEWLGNHPQAYTHLGLINAVLACERLAPPR